LRIAISIWSLR